MCGYVLHRYLQFPWERAPKLLGRGRNQKLEFSLVLLHTNLTSERFQIVVLAMRTTGITDNLDMKYTHCTRHLEFSPSYSLLPSLFPVLVFVACLDGGEGLDLVLSLSSSCVCTTSNHLRLSGGGPKATSVYLFLFHLNTTNLFQLKSSFSHSYIYTLHVSLRSASLSNLMYKVSFG